MTNINTKWSRTFRYWLLTFIVIFLVIFLWYTRAMIAPLIIAALIAYVMNPAVALSMRYTRLSRPLTIAIILILGLSILIGVPALIIPTLLSELQLLTVDLQKTSLQILNVLSQPVKILNWEIQISHLLSDPTQWISEGTQMITENALYLIESTSRNLLWFLVILISTYYLLRDWDHLRDWLLSLPPKQQQADARRVYSEIRQVWQGYLWGNLTLMTIVGVTFTLAWFALGVPGALILGVIAGILTIIPDLGPAIAAGLAIIVALIEGSTYLPVSNFWFALMVTGAYLGLINIKNIWIRPRIFGRSVHMHDGIVFVAIIVAVVIWGILGALIIVPTLASMGVLGKYIYSRLIGEEPWPAEQPVPVVDEPPAEVVLVETRDSPPVDH